MRRIFCMVLVIIAACAQGAFGQDEGEQRIRKALEGRFMLVNMDLPAIDTGVPLILDNLEVSYDAANYKTLVKEYGVAIKKGSRAKITGVRISRRGIEIDLDGGGMAGRDWIVGSLQLVQPAPLPKSDHEVGIERQIQSDPNSGGYLRGELEYERQRRLAQDDRNQEAYKQVEGLRSRYIEANRKNWGSKVIVVVRSRKEAVK